MPKNADAGEPVKSHFKCVIMDEEITILGSGNMDRASWYTSQELGIAFVSREVAKCKYPNIELVEISKVLTSGAAIRQCVDEGLEGWVEYIC